MVTSWSVDQQCLRVAPDANLSLPDELALPRSSFVREA